MNAVLHVDIHKDGKNFWWVLKILSVIASTSSTFYCIILEFPGILKILTEYFQKFRFEITMWECSLHTLFWDENKNINPTTPTENIP